MNMQDIVSIKSWSDIEERPNYVKSIQMKKDSKTNEFELKLIQILGTYILNPKVKCGISGCGQMHNSGYLVLLSDKMETNIGNTCGKNHFGTDFSTSKKIINELKTEKEYLDRVGDFIKISSLLQKEIHEIQYPKEGTSLVKIYQAIYFLTQNVEPLGENLTRRIRNLIGSDGAVKKTVEKTKEAIKIEQVAAKENKRNISSYDEIFVGRVDGYQLINRYKQITEVRNFFLELFEGTINKDVYAITKQRRKMLAKKINDYNSKKEELMEIMKLGSRLCMKINFELIQSQLTLEEARKVKMLWEKIDKIA